MYIFLTILFFKNFLFQKLYKRQEKNRYTSGTIHFAIDPARNLYLADEELGVLIFAPDAKLMATISGEELRRPRALTLDAGGAIFVYDEKLQRVVRFK